MTTHEHQDFFAPLEQARTVLLTTYRRNGTPVPTPGHVVAAGDKAYIRTFDPSGKVKRIRNNPDVEVAPSTTRGKVTGDSRPAHARILHGDEAATVAQALGRKYRIVHGHLIPWYHRRKGLTTIHVELTPR